MPVFVPAFFEERRQGRRRCSLKGRSTVALPVAVELYPLDAAIGNHAAAEPHGFIRVALVAVEPAPRNPAAVHKRALFNGVDAGGRIPGVFGENLTVTGPLEAAMYSSGPTAMKSAPARSGGRDGAGVAGGAGGLRGRV